ncbi:DUF1848 domain-containing protein [Eubacteriaceae bacterium ES2]|nr:DUF1848 domain-containing protein [Eubacteriaceae bacterium ES2]
MILNTGNRTDIPAFYSEWFYNRIEEGCVLVRNPYYFNQVTLYLLNPELVDCLVFCTKNPQPMLERIQEIKIFNQFWFVTITPYGIDIEPNVPNAALVMKDFTQLSEKIGVKALGWRYDPIFISEKYTLDFHLEKFAEMASYLKGYTEQCVISFVDLYRKTCRNFPGIRSVTTEEKEIIGKSFSIIAKKNNMILRTCNEGRALEKYEIDSSGCLTRPVIERAIGHNLKIPKNRFETREGCNCLLGNDIGVYNSCRHGCLYCYANEDMSQVERNFKKHDPNSRLLIGNIMPVDKIKLAKQVSYIDRQISFLKP